MVLYKGAFVDIEKLLDQMRRSEKARDDTEQMLVDLRKTNAELLASNTRSKDKIKDLQSDVKSYSRKLSDVEQTLSSTSVCHYVFFSIYILFNNCAIFLIFFSFVEKVKRISFYPVQRIWSCVSGVCKIWTQYVQKRYVSYFRLLQEYIPIKKTKFSFVTCRSREKDKERGEKKERNVKEKEITEDREKEKEDTKDAIKTEVKKE